MLTKYNAWNEDRSKWNRTLLINNKFQSLNHGSTRLLRTLIWFFNTWIQGLGISKPKCKCFNLKDQLFKKLVLLLLLRSKMPITGIGI